MQKEAKARLKINKLLEESGWRLLDTFDGKANVIVEGNVHIEGVSEDRIGNDYEYVYQGYIDYLLLGENNYPLCVLEAKSESKNPLDGKEQARRYANNKRVRFVILSNGNLHYFWDLICGNPIVISTFPTPESIKHVESFKPNPTKLADVEVPDDYIALTQMPEHKTDPRWNNETQRKAFIEEKGLKFLRPYQLNAISAMQRSVKDGSNRFLFEMATGTGKTLVSAAVIIFCKTFLENALKDPISGEIGKTIVFCVSQDHASKVTQVLNEYAHQSWPGKYNSDFALQITSRIPDSQQFTVNFANNNLRGHTRFLEGYKSSKTRVCVTVGMMTTGYDCEDILNLCLMRPIFSPTDFIQIKGRGTRKFTFLPVSRNQAEGQEGRVKKERYKLFDFFANCEYFEEHYNYDEVIPLPPETGVAGPGGDGPAVADEATVTIPDPLKTFTETEIGPQGMKVDHKLFESFESKVKEDTFIKENFEKGNIDAVEEYVKKEVFDKPEEYFNLPKLRKSIQADRRITLREVLEKIFGLISRFKSKDELLNDEYEKFILINKPDSQYVIGGRNYFKSYITDSGFRELIDHKDYTQLNSYPGFTMSEFKQLNSWRDKIPEYIKDYVPINKFI